MSSQESRKPIAVYGAMAANLIIALSKCAAAIITGSSAMLSEGIHSWVDTGDQLLLLWGTHQSRKAADPLHPFGHGQELYFWGLIVAIILFGIGGGMSVYEGLTHLEHPTTLESPTANYIVLAIAAVFESISLTIGLRQLLAQRTGESIWQTIRNSKDPAVFVVVFEDSAAVLGVLIAFAGVFLGHRLNSPVPDAIASILIGLILASVAIFLAHESKGLLLGERADSRILRNITRLVQRDRDVVRMGQPLTMHFGPDQILLALEIQFRKDLSGGELAAAVDRLEQAIQQDHPQIKQIFLEAESLIQSELQDGKQPQTAHQPRAADGQASH